MITTAVVGASGYSGAELLRLLLGRRDLCVRNLFAASSAGKHVADLYPSFRGRTDLRYEPFDPSAVSGVDVVFVALPSGEAMNVVPAILPQVRAVIDLGGDFRLPSAGLYEEYYRHPHAARELLPGAVYGLPEINRESLPGAALVANPGCYPTSAILALLPALKNGVIEAKGIVVTSMSGVTGAGRTASVDYSFSELNENIRAYKIGHHQHLPEITTVLERATGSAVSLSFVPHLVPMNRGIYTTIHANLTGAAAAEDLREMYRTFYAGEPFVRVRDDVPQVKDVLRTNYCDIGVHVEPHTRQLILTSTIDNLVKGAAGQAIQNFNIMQHLPEQTGLA